MSQFTFRSRNLFLILSTCSLFNGCAAPRAVMYPEDDLPKRSAAVRDLQQCETQGKSTIGLNAGKDRTLRNAGAAGAIGAAATASALVVRKSNDVLTNAAAAGVAGGIGVLVKGALEVNHPDRVYEEFIKQCMKKRGHQVLGWR